MRRLIGIFLATGWLLLVGPRATASESLRAYVRNELDRLAESEPAPSACFSPDTEQSWQMRRFYLSLAPQVGVGITMGVAELSIQPSLQLMWEKPIPPDWVPYRPGTGSAFQETE